MLFDEETEEAGRVLRECVVDDVDEGVGFDWLGPGMYVKLPERWF